LNSPYPELKAVIEGGRPLSPSSWATTPGSTPRRYSWRFSAPRATRWVSSARTFPPIACA
jgi:hypothetical protein